MRKTRAPEQTRHIFSRETYRDEQGTKKTLEERVREFDQRIGNFCADCPPKKDL